MDAIEDTSEPSRTLPPLVREILREWMIQAMQGISEDHYAAGWMSGLEHAVWDAVQRLPNLTCYGGGEVERRRLEKLRDVSALLGEWTDGGRFIALPEWKQSAERGRLRRSF